MRRTLITAAALLGLSVQVMTSNADAAASRSSFIVVLQPGTADVPGVAADMAASARGELGFVYEHALQGFSITASDAAAAALARNPRVAYVERDQQVSIAEDVDVPTGIDRIFATHNLAIDIDGSDDQRVDVDVAVIDTGVDFQHPDLDVQGGVNCASGGPFGGSCMSGGDDDHYHGTHVAGTIGALDNGDGIVGVAPGARIWAVKVLNSRGSGYTSWIVGGIDWVAANASTIEVANMSLGGKGFSQAEYDAIQGAVDNGVAFAVAAGNDDDDASKYSPAAFDNALTVSALADFDGAPGATGFPTCRADEDDTLANFSNWGSAVDIAAPGVCILSTYPIEQGGYGTISGTSMASPHVAGALALLASRADGSSVSDLYQQVIAAGNHDWTDDSGDTIFEPLLDVSTFRPVLVPGPGSGTTNHAPTVSIGSPTAGNHPSGSSFTLTAQTDDADGDPLTVTWTANDSPISSPWSPTDGAYTIVALADDGHGGTATDSVAITVGTVVQPDLVGSSTSEGRTWTATVSNNGAASVTGTWSIGNAGPCTAAQGESCSLGGISKKTASVTFTPESGEPVVILKP